ncbi:MAG: peroxiredoxin [Actinomycetota bacterium]
MESAHFRDLSSEFAALDARIAGISADQVDRQQEFHSENGLGFPLLSDPDKSIIKQFGVNRFGPLPNKRATFVIGADRTVMAVITSETNMKGHADEALDALRSATAA